MAIDKSLISGNTDMLILKLLEKQDMYGYQMIEELAKQSDHTFELNTVLKNYPLYCPKCKQETLIEAENLKVTVIKKQEN